MSRPTDACQSCGERNLIAVCTVIAEYAIANEGEGEQDWSRRSVDDDTSVPTHFRCESCGADFGRFTLDGNGFLIGLGPRAGNAANHTDAMTAEGFREWLSATVADWCEERSLPSEGEGEDLGDLYRHLDDAGAWDAIGVTPVPSHEDQTLHLVGPHASWIATTGIELGIEGETIWHDPLSSLHLDVPVEGLRQHGDRLRRRADEVANLLAGHDSRDRER